MIPMKVNVCLKGDIRYYLHLLLTYRLVECQEEGEGDLKKAIRAAYIFSEQGQCRNGVYLLSYNCRCLLQAPFQQCFRIFFAMSVARLNNNGMDEQQH